MFCLAVIRPCFPAGGCGRECSSAGQQSIPRGKTWQSQASHAADLDLAYPSKVQGFTLANGGNRRRKLPRQGARGMPANKLGSHRTGTVTGTDRNGVKPTHLIPLKNPRKRPSHPAFSGPKKGREELKVSGTFSRNQGTKGVRNSRGTNRGTKGVRYFFQRWKS